MSKPRILISGSDGQMGSFLKDELKDYDCKFFDKKDFNISKSDHIDRIFEDKNIKIFVNLAAFTMVDQAEIDRDFCFNINSISLNKISRKCAEKKILLIHLSTDYIFDGNQDIAYTEESIPNPINFYGLSKLAGEQNIINSLSDYLIIRTSWIFSEKGKNFFKSIFKNSRIENVLEIIGDQVGSPTYAGDLSKVIKMFIEKKLNNRDYHPREIYNFSGIPKCSWFDFAEEIVNKMKEKKIIQHEINLIKTLSSDQNYIAKRPKFSFLNSKKICNELKVVPSNWKKGIEVSLSKLIN
jgi:dTDP-4-dehydrorhamnose reductase